MSENRPECRSTCPISLALDVLGDKWSLIIVRDMMFRDYTRYGEFLQSEEGISTNILASRLQRLEAADLISRETGSVEAAGKPRYLLTPKGQALRPVLDVLGRWSLAHNQGAKLSSDVLEAMLAREKRE